MDEEGALDEVVKGAAGLIHVVRIHLTYILCMASLTAQASDVTLSPDPTTVIPNAVNLTVNALKAAAKEPSIKRVVLTSSSSAVLVPEPEKEVVVDESA